MTTPTGEGAQSGAEGTQSGAGENTGASNGSTDTSTGTGAQSGTQTATDTTTGNMVPQSEVDAVRERMRAADQRAAKFEQELRQLRDKDLPEAEKLKRDFTESQEQVKTLTETNNALALKVAFLSDNTYSWHNAERALKLVDLSQVEINADGSVSGLKEALKALATSDPYLVKQEAKEETKTPPGTAPGNNGGSAPQKPGTKGLAARIPALTTRVRKS